MLDPSRRARIPDADIQPIHIDEPTAVRRGNCGERCVREAAAALVQAAEAPGFKLPMLPETANEAMSLAADPNIAMRRLERVIVSDTVLTARMLTVASSPAYGGVPLRSLGAALQRLGSGAIRDVLYQSVMECHMFRGDDERVARAQREHAVAVARLSKAICKVAGIDDGQAFVTGLLHDIGMLALQALRKLPATAHLDPDDIQKVEEIVHTTLGARMAAGWKLHPQVIEGIRRHHRYRDYEPGAYSQIGHVIAVADIIVHHLGLGGTPHPLTDEQHAEIAALGLDPAQVIAVAGAALLGS
ncbi:MAG: HDOD domain-containing protein [Deltaproteobacteria bacterium]|nr:HDOD domain-containing protein [Deltaproteobacteria bacterium]MBK8720034.1 HDOD domain-containing protein [Deltaproteobacteria bacterium]MBP7292280.1 HDOD domain-containing protein [Nannocystaceae bacterium]